MIREVNGYMKKLCGAMFAGCLVCLCLLLFPLSVSAAEEVAYTEEQEAVFEKVGELARLRALDHYNDDPARIKQLIQELDTMGAVPDDQLLTELTLDKTFKRDGERVENMADFRAAYADIFDVFAIRHTVLPSYGEFEVCEIMIQEVIREEDRFEKVTGVLSSSSIHEVFTYKVSDTSWWKQFMQLIIKGTDSPIIHHGNTNPGYSRVFTVRTTLHPTLHMIFVKKSGSNQWKHTLTTHSIALSEEYDWYYVGNEKGTATVHNGQHETENTLLQPNGYDTRLYDAITAYRRELSEPVADVIEQYDNLVDVTALAGLRDNGKDIIFEYRVDIPCPSTPAEIARLVKRVERSEWWTAFYEEHRIVLWITAAAVAIPIFWGIFTLLERRVRRWSYRRWKKKQEKQ